MMYGSEDMQKWLGTEPPIICQNDQGFDYIPIRDLEDTLDEYDPFWARENHRYHFVEVGDYLYLSTSIQIVVVASRVLTGGSMLKLNDYPDNENIIQTGISEATKAAAKVLGRRFGKYLNENRRETPAREPKTIKKLPADHSIRQIYARSVAEGIWGVVERLESIYDFSQPAKTVTY